MSHQSDLDNHANQCNPNNDAYWESREDQSHNHEHDDQQDSHDSKSNWSLPFKIAKTKSRQCRTCNVLYSGRSCPYNIKIKEVRNEQSQ